MSELLKPFYQIITAPPRQWHPVLIHFPIVFLVLEAGLIGLFQCTKKPEYERWAYAFLHWSVWTLLIVAIAGVRDSGLDLGDGNKLWLGLQDRWKNAFRFQSSITVHSWLTAGLLAITVARLFWRKLGGPSVLSGARGYGYAFVTFIGLWFLTAAAYVGGLISHK